MASNVQFTTNLTNNKSIEVADLFLTCHLHDIIHIPVVNETRPSCFFLFVFLLCCSSTLCIVVNANGRVIMAEASPAEVPRLLTLV